MPNQRKQGVQTLTITLPDEMLARIEREAKRLKINRLELIRQMFEAYFEAKKK